MDWFSWLSKTSLESSEVYEYALTFAENELEKEDIAYINHECLHSMGITIAKHRLEILKLARKEKRHVFSLKFPMAKLLLILKKTKKSMTNYIATLVHGQDSKALIVLSNKYMLKRKNKGGGGGGGGGGAISYSSRWKRSMMMGNNDSKKLLMVNSGPNQESLMLTNGDFEGFDCEDIMIVSTPKLECYSSPLMYDLQHKEENKIHDDDDDDDDDQCWTPAIEEIKWDAMFEDLKPT